jgi:hypothetical protein
LSRFSVQLQLLSTQGGWLLKLLCSQQSNTLWPSLHCVATFTIYIQNIHQCMDGSSSSGSSGYEGYQSRFYPSRPSAPKQSASALTPLPLPWPFTPASGLSSQQIVSPDKQVTELGKLRPFMISPCHHQPFDQISYSLEMAPAEETAPAVESPTQPDAETVEAAVVPELPKAEPTTVENIAPKTEVSILTPVEEVSSHLLPKSSRQAGSHLLPESSWPAGSHLLPKSSWKAGTCFMRAFCKQITTCLPRALGKPSR